MDGYAENRHSEYRNEEDEGMLWEAYESGYHPHDDDDDERGAGMTAAAATDTTSNLNHSTRVPSLVTLQQRWDFRRAIQDQTLQHRRIHSQGLGFEGRHVCLTLCDRERHGHRHVVYSQNQAMHSSNAIDTGDDEAMSRDNKQSQKRHHHHKSGKSSATAGGHTATTSSLRRAAPYPKVLARELEAFGEYCSVARYHSAYLHHLGGPGSLQDDAPGGHSNDEDEDAPTSTTAVSTISIAFSPDAHTMASTHGDHTVKITCCSTGALLESLEGHPRTPWTVKFHPSNPHLLASGCLGFQVRIWNWNEPRCLHMIRLDYAIISLSFHPDGHVLAIASGSRIHIWDYDNHAGNTGPDDAATTPGGTQQQARGALIGVDQRHMLRCVHFPPNGTTLIVGGMNPPTENSRPPGRLGGMSGGGMSFYLRLWDFDQDAVLHANQHDMSPDGTPSRTPKLRMQKKALNNPRTFVPRALLYNDGGFDVSPDGRTLCACAEYWLPEGVSSAMELLQREECEYDSSSHMEDETMSDEETTAMAMSPATVMATPTSTPRTTHQRPADTDDDIGHDTPDSSAQDTASYSTPPRRRLSRPSASSSRSNHERSQTSQSETNPITPPNPQRPETRLSPPPPPGLRFAGGLGQSRSYSGRGSSRLQPFISSNSEYPLRATNPSIPPPPSSANVSHLPLRPPHPLSVVTGSSMYADVTRQPGRYVPHVVTISLDTTLFSPSAYPGDPLTSVARGYRPRLGQLLEACPLDGAKASAVTCVKFSPSANFCLLGYGVREPVSSENGEDSRFHPVTSLYRVTGGMTHVSTMLSGDDDVNIARFHPDAGYGFVYGTKQGRVRVSSPRPWNFYSKLPHES